MKSLNEWLESSDDEGNNSRAGSRRGSLARSEGSPAASIPQSMDSPTMARRGPKQLAIKTPAAAVGSAGLTTADSRRQQEAEERRRKQEEMRDKMRELVGEAVVDRIEAQVRKVNESDDSNSTFSSTQNLQMPASLPPVVPPSARSSQEVPQGGLRRVPPPLETTNLGGVMNSGQFNPRSSFSGTSDQHQQQMLGAVEVVDVMLADRGTQTVSNAECQTDPDFGAVNCAGCYRDRYGHPPPTNRCPHGVPGYAAGDDGQQADPIFAAMLAGHSASRGYGPSAGALNYGRPLMPSSTSAALWQAQLRTIQQTIDMCISKYNLPAAPAAR